MCQGAVKYVWFKTAVVDKMMPKTQQKQQQQDILQCDFNSVNVFIQKKNTHKAFSNNPNFS